MTATLSRARPTRRSLSRARSVVRVRDLRSKIHFTLAVVVIYRLGANILCPGINYAAVTQLTSSPSNGVASYLNLFSGGALTKLAVFGLGIVLYITSSIITQLLMVVIPNIRTMARPGRRSSLIGRREYGGQSTYIPMKVNRGGMVPIIFASSVLYFPILISNVLPSHGWGLSTQTWINVHLAQPDNAVYIIAYGAMILGFAYFYAAITFDPHQQAETIRKQGGYISGIRPGPPTERHLTHILNRITLPGALWAAAIALIPSVFLAIWNIQNYPFAGTTLLSAVGVALETMKQVNSQLTLRTTKASPMTDPQTRPATFAWPIRTFGRRPTGRSHRTPPTSLASAPTRTDQ